MQQVERIITVNQCSFSRNFNILPPFLFTPYFILPYSNQRLVPCTTPAPLRRHAEPKLTSKSNNPDVQVAVRSCMRASSHSRVGRRRRHSCRAWTWTCRASFTPRTGLRAVFFLFRQQAKSIQSGAFKVSNGNTAGIRACVRACVSNNRQGDAQPHKAIIGNGDNPSG